MRRLESGVLVERSDRRLTEGKGSGVERDSREPRRFADRVKWRSGYGSYPSYAAPWRGVGGVRTVGERGGGVDAAIPEPLEHA